MFDRLLLYLCQVAPKGLTEVITMGCGTCAVENAFKVVFMSYQVCNGEMALLILR